MVCLPTQEPLLCPRAEKAQRETRNTLQQLLFIEDLLRQGVRQIRDSHVRELHRLAIDGIYGCGGEYRTVTRSAELEGGEVSHIPPEPALVPGLLHDTLERVNAELQINAGLARARSRLPGAVATASYMLWRFNWIHPFAGGNGRTARALTYLVFCIDFGSTIPGLPSFPTLIERRRRAYEVALRQGDSGEREGRETLSKMRKLVGRAIVVQLTNAMNEAIAIWRRRAKKMKKKKNNKHNKNRNRPSRFRP
jgi:Fic family protein